MLLLKSLPANTVPTTSVISSMTAALQVNEAVAFLHNTSEHLKPGQKLFVSLKPYKFFIVDIPRDPNCMAHEVIIPNMNVQHSSDNLTVSELLELVPGSHSLELDYDIVTSLSCTRCGAEPYCLPVKKFRVESVDCPKCGQRRSPNTVHQVLRTDALATKRLSDIGIPNSAILRVNAGEEVVYVAIR